MIVIETFARGCEPKHRPHRRRSGSTPHDAVASDPPPQQHPAFCLASSRQRPSSHRYAGFAATRATNLVVPRPDRSFKPANATMARGMPFAATASIQPHQAKARSKIPIGLAAPPPHTSRDFVPWRFSAAGRLTAWIGHHPGSRKPAHIQPPAPQQAALLASSFGLDACRLDHRPPLFDLGFCKDISRGVVWFGACEPELRDHG